jgi:hypothetical protein
MGCGQRLAQPTSAPPDPQGSPPTATAPPAPDLVVIQFRVERDAVAVKPGGEVKVKLLSVPEGEDLRVTVEPPDSQITAVVADREVLTVRAGEDAKGEAAVTVKAGQESAKVRVTVNGG